MNDVVIANRYEAELDDGWYVLYKKQGEDLT